MSDSVDMLSEELNPLDSVEDILTSNNWTFNRMNSDELMVKVAGKFCEYRLFFIWQEDMNAMQFCAQYDMQVHESNCKEVGQALMSINENLWMGHFDVPRETRTPSFRYTCIVHDLNQSTQGQLGDIVDIALTQCERYYPAFRLLTDAGAAQHASLPLALMETQGVS